MVAVSESRGYPAFNARRLVVTEGPSVSSVGAEPSEFDLGQATTIAVVVSGGTYPLAYGYAGLPPGCAAGNAPRLNCTPTVAGNYTVSVTATDAIGMSVRSELGLTVNPTPTIVYFGLSPTKITVGETTNLTTVAVGGSSPLEYVYTNLPPGCASVNASSLVCQPARAGQYAILVVVTDARGIASGVAQASLQVLAPVPLPVIRYFGPNVNPANVGTAMTFTVEVAGGTGPWSYVYRGLPGGCSSANQTTLACVPASAGYYNVSVRVIGSQGQSALAWTLLTVLAASNVTPPTHPSQTVSWNSIWWTVALALVGGTIVGVIVGRFALGRKKPHVDSPPPGTS